MKTPTKTHTKARVKTSVSARKPRKVKLPDTLSAIVVFPEEKKDEISVVPTVAIEKYEARVEVKPDKNFEIKPNFPDPLSVLALLPPEPEDEGWDDLSGDDLAWNDPAYDDLPYTVELKTIVEAPSAAAQLPEPEMMVEVPMAKEIEPVEVILEDEKPASVSNVAASVDSLLPEAMSAILPLEEEIPEVEDETTEQLEEFEVREAMSIPAAYAAKPSMLNVAAKISKWIKGHVKIQPNKKRLRVCESVSLGDKRFIAVVQLDGKEFLVGGAPNSLSLLANVGKNATFSEVLNESYEQGRMQG